MSSYRDLLKNEQRCASLKSVICLYAMVDIFKEEYLFYQKDGRDWLPRFENYLVGQSRPSELQNGSSFKKHLFQLCIVISAHVRWIPCL
jgi:hypothetical protein